MSTHQWFSLATWEAIAWRGQVLMWLCALLGTLAGIVIYLAKTNTDIIKQEKAKRAQALQTERSLQRFPREQDAQDFFEKIKRLPKVSYWIITETDDRDPGSEQMRVTRIFDSIFAKAGWVKESKITGGRVYTRVTTRGISVGFRTDDSKGKEIADAIVSAFRSVGIDASADAFSDLPSGWFTFQVGLR